jgi:small subunit ribosomal protein S6
MRGKRRLAYQIAKHREGIYVQLSHQGDGQHIFKIEKAMRLSEDVIRYLTVKQEGPLPTPRSSSKGSNQAEKKEIEVFTLVNGMKICIQVIHFMFNLEEA